MREFVLHPFVRIHLINMETMNYLHKTDVDQGGIYNIESAGYFNKAKKFVSEKVDYYLPMSTKLYDLRVKAEHKANWNEDFTIDIKLERFFDKNTLVLFEILDFNPALIGSK